MWHVMCHVCNEILGWAQLGTGLEQVITTAPLCKLHLWLLDPFLLTARAVAFQIFPRHLLSMPRQLFIAHAIQLVVTKCEAVAFEIAKIMGDITDVHKWLVSVYLSASWQTLSEMGHCNWRNPACLTIPCSTSAFADPEKSASKTLFFTHSCFMCTHLTVGLAVSIVTSLSSICLCFKIHFP